jgi:hypothetical protein
MQPFRQISCSDFLEFTGSKWSLAFKNNETDSLGERAAGCWPRYAQNRNWRTIFL